MEKTEACDKRIAILAVMITDARAVEAVNALLHEFAGCILGRMGMPIRDRGLNAITLILDAAVNAVNALTGKLGAIPGVSAKALFGKV